MAIRVNQKENYILFTLDTESSSYQMAADCNGVLLHLYYGEKLEAEDDLSDLILKTDMGFSGNPSCAKDDRTYSLDTLPQEISGFGTGDYRESMIVIRHPDGSRACEFRYDGYELLDESYVVEGMPALYDTKEEKGQTLLITMKEIASDVELKLYYGIFEACNVVTRAVKIINQNKDEIMVERCLSMNMDMMYADYDLIYFAGRHAYERKPERTNVGHAKVEIGSVRGASSHQYNPAFILCDKTATEDAGNCYGFCFAYSGNFMAAAQKDQKNQVRVLMGIQPQGFSYCLGQNESFMAPQVIMSYSGSGLDRLSHQYHDVLREHMCRGTYKHKKRPVLINSWEAAYFDFDEEKLLEIGRQAADLGIEMLVLDDGWFGTRDSEDSGLGDWYANEKKLGGSLKKLGDNLNAMGLQFGLWVEPEMISEDSDLYRSHPDWALCIPGREPNRGRNQLVLDMSREDVREYLLERLTDILSNAPIKYLKWDMNRSVCDLFSHNLDAVHGGELYHRFVLGVYDLLERMLNRFPDLLLEGCCGGGGRFDAGMLYYAPQIWCSDNTDAVNRLMIQYGTSFFYPISSMGAHVSACPNHQTERSVPFTMRGDVALSGSFGYELDPGKITDEEKQMIREQLVQYHRLYPLTHEGTYYRLTPVENADYVAWEFVSKDQQSAAFTLIQTEREGNPLPTHIYLKGLAPEKTYRCKIDGVHMERSGRAFMYGGITIPRVLKQYESMTIELETCISES